MINQEKEELKKLIEKKGLLKSNNKPFELASGKKTHYFFDMKPVLLEPKGVNLISNCLFKKIKDSNIKYIGGLESGAIPIVTALCMKSWRENKPLYGFFVRKEPKKRGTNKIIEGNLKKGEKVIIIDDVTTTGGSVLKAIEEVKKFGCEVVKVLSIVDRESGARQRFKNINVEFDTLFTKSDFPIENNG